MNTWQISWYVFIKYLKVFCFYVIPYIIVKEEQANKL